MNKGSLSMVLHNVVNRDPWASQTYGFRKPPNEPLCLELSVATGHNWSPVTGWP